VIGIIGGGVPFILFFTGLAQASAPSAAFIQKTLFVWVAILAVPFLGERLGLAQLAAVGVLLAGLTLVAPPTGLSWGSGETMIAAATLLWAVEAIMAKRLLRGVPVAVLGVGRLGIGLLVLVGYLLATGHASLVLALDGAQMLAVLGTGVLLAGYVATWFAALKRAPASLVTAVLVVGAPVTAMLQAIQGGGIPAPSPVLAGEAAILLAAGVLALLAVRRPRTAPAAA
ncbi:MAG TPA: DMT family transporter, partial [Candidatus Binatus sp.]|nr:DMT family transporter [Candidatus Binatus sp.]